MNAHPGTNPTFPGAPRRFGPNPFAFVLVLLGLVAFAVFVGESRQPSGTSAPEPSVAPPNVTWTFSGSVDRRGWTYYVVGSEAEAAAMRSNLADSDAIRNALGEPVLLGSVYVAASDEEAVGFTTAVAEGNLALVALGLGEDRVVDLRAR